MTRVLAWAPNKEEIWCSWVPDPVLVLIGVLYLVQFERANRFIKFVWSEFIRVVLSEFNSKSSWPYLCRNYRLYQDKHEPNPTLELLSRGVSVDYDCMLWRIFGVDCVGNEENDPVLFSYHISGPIFWRSASLSCKYANLSWWVFCSVAINDYTSGDQWSWEIVVMLGLRPYSEVLVRMRSRLAWS